MKRTALDSSLCQETDYYTDEQGIFSSRSKLLPGLKSFYTTTGVQPYIYTTEESDFSNVDDIYEQLFTDEGHLLLLIHVEYEDDGNESWNAYSYLGSDAAAVIDTDLLDQFWLYYDKYYADDSLTAEQVLSQSFAQTAAIFSGSSTDTASVSTTGSSSPLRWIVLAVALVLCVGIIFMIVSSRRKSYTTTDSTGQEDIFSQMEKENKDDTLS